MNTIFCAAFALLAAIAPKQVQPVEISIARECPKGMLPGVVELTPYVLTMNGTEVLRVNRDGSVTLKRPLTPAEAAILDDDWNWKWAPVAKALIKAAQAAK